MILSTIQQIANGQAEVINLGGKIKKIREMLAQLTTDNCDEARLSFSFVNQDKRAKSADLTRFTGIGGFLAGRQFYQIEDSCNSDITKEEPACSYLTCSLTINAAIRFLSILLDECMTTREKLMAELENLIVQQQIDITHEHI